MSPRTGRPKSEDPKTERLFIRVTQKEKDEIQAFTRESGLSLLSLIRIGIETAKKK